MMKERILQIMRKENMTQQDFAKAIEVSPASLSNIFNGKTNPTNNHVNAIHRRFPNISINWLMFGEGDMYTTVANKTNEAVGPLWESLEERTVSSPESGNTGGTTLRTNASGALSDVKENAGNAETQADTAATPVVREIVKYIDKPQRRITEIRIFFDDGTFEVFSK